MYKSVRGIEMKCSTDKRLIATVAVQGSAVVFSPPNDCNIDCFCIRPLRCSYAERFKGLFQTAHRGAGALKKELLSALAVCRKLLRGIFS